MIMTLIISIATIISLILMIVLKPTIKINKLEFQTFWIIPIFGVILLLVTKQTTLLAVKEMLFSDSSINPIKILVLFLSISFLSIVLDELGFFRKCAELATKITKGSQYKLFFFNFAYCLDFNYFHIK